MACNLKIQYAFLEGTNVILVMNDNSTVPIPIYSTAQPQDYGPTGRQGIPGPDIISITSVPTGSNVLLKFDMSNNSTLYTNANPLIVKGDTGAMGPQTVSVGVDSTGVVQATYDNGLTTNIGKVQSVTGSIGYGIYSMTIDDRGRLVVTLDNNSTIVCGYLMSPANTPPAGSRRVYVDPLTGQLYAVAN